MQTLCIVHTPSGAHIMGGPKKITPPYRRSLGFDPSEWTRPLDRPMTHSNRLDLWAADDRNRMIGWADILYIGRAHPDLQIPLAPIPKWASMWDPQQGVHGAHA
eukprot:TRINITY_DN8839_c3_g3_i2.p1 TRINITY_DN8839_c3_g3~~TRINITY_DN8839_c3_g3_i2.p1  ORF type:complete len:104 (-),score=3.02 TRINITY_DN8839_c3_g3_i2:104-415(-)